MASQIKILKAARSRWGRGVYIRECKTAVSAIDRARLGLERRILREALKKTEDLGTNGKVLEALAWLVKAARFVVDVGGDEPSIPQLEGPLLQAERLLDILDDRAVAWGRIRQIDRAGIHVKRFTVLRPGVIGETVLVDADTLTELEECVARGGVYGEPVEEAPRG